MSRPERLRRVNEVLRETVAEEITLLKDPRLGFITVTGVDTSPDLRAAVVYYSVLGTDEEQAATADALEHAAPRIQARVGRQVRLKYLPRLRFERDDAMERGLRIQELLQELEGEHGERDDSVSPEGGG